MSVFEAGMLLCFGAAWPFSVYKSYKSRKNSGKSLLFMVIIFIGYISGSIHKIFYNFDLIIILYIFNGILVLTDIILYFRNKAIAEQID